MVGWGVAEGQGVDEGTGVGDGNAVFVAVLVRVGDLDAVGVALGTAVGGSPSTVKLPLRFHVKPVKICTSYSPGSHSCGSASQSVNPSPPEPPSHASVS